MNTREKMLKDILAHLEKTGMAESKFSLLVTNSPGLVTRLRAGQDVVTGTMDAAYKFMEDNSRLGHSPD